MKVKQDFTLPFWIMNILLNTLKKYEKLYETINNSNHKKYSN